MIEKLEILNMIKEGRISPEEGVRLIEAIDRADETERSGRARSGASRWLLVEIMDKRGEKIKSLPPIRIPFSVVRLFFRFIPKDYILPGSFSGPEEMLESLESRKPLDLYSESDGFTIRLSAE